MIAKYFFTEGPSGWNRLRSRWDHERAVVMLLDYDGTLVPICPQPSQAVLSPATKKKLQDLSCQPGVTVALITGRALDDIRKMVGLKHLIYVANHGFEIRTDQHAWVHPRAKSLMLPLARIFFELEKALSAIPEALVENKFLTLSIHYRNVREDLVPQIKKMVDSIMRPCHRAFKITRGKKVIEIRPNIRWDKGLGALHLLQMLATPQKPLIFYIGDDRTDEDAFRRLRACAVTIKVGKGHSSRAKYFVKNQEEVQKILEQIIAINLSKDSKLNT